MRIVLAEPAVLFTTLGDIRGMGYLFFRVSRCAAPAVALRILTANDSAVTADRRLASAARGAVPKTLPIRNSAAPAAPISPNQRPLHGQPSPRPHPSWSNTASHTKRPTESVAR